MKIKWVRALVGVLFAAAPLTATTREIAVWAIGDSVRIDPVRNQAFEDNQKLFPDGMRGNYKESNLIWNGSARRISVKAARNETIAFQIVIERTSEKLLEYEPCIG